MVTFTMIILVFSLYTLLVGMTYLILASPQDSLLSVVTFIGDTPLSTGLIDFSV